MAGIYVHVPFCKKRCIYCDFYTQTELTYKKQYIDALCKEAVLRKDYIKGETIDTIYFGGGTPSLFNKSDFEFIFDTLASYFDISAEPEITIEANPDDLNEDYIKDLSALPLNRISIGIQSFNDNDLEFLNRRHSAIQAIEAVRECQKAGFENISIDMMYGLPGQTTDMWIDNVYQAVRLGIQHISAYHLIYEENTRLFSLWERREVAPVDDNLSVDMFSAMISMLSEAGYIHYEISNFAKEGYFSKHNSSYWLGNKYLGLGAAAHSYDRESRTWNISSIKEYIKGIDAGAPAEEIEFLDNHIRYNEFIMTGLRTMWGVDLHKLNDMFGEDMLTYCLKNVKKYIEGGLASIDNDILKLTKKGVFLSDGIMSDLMYVEDHI